MSGFSFHVRNAAGERIATFRDADDAVNCCVYLESFEGIGQTITYTSGGPILWRHGMEPNVHRMRLIMDATNIIHERVSAYIMGNWKQYKKEHGIA